MLYRSITRKLSKSIAILAASPMLLNTFGQDGISVNASIGTKISVNNPRVGSRVSVPGNNMVGLNTKKLPNSNLPSSSLSNSPIYKPTKSEKALAGISLGVSTVSVIGTAVGLALTQEQYKQAEDTYGYVVERTYNSFYDEREKYMKDLFAKWGVPLPDKYKNPINKDINNEPTPGFNIGVGE